MFIRERDAARRALVGEKKAEREAENSARETSRARRAEADAKDKLWDSYLAQAQARRSSGRMGRRFESLEALRKAAEIRPSLQLRKEAIACMALPDFRVTKEWQTKISDGVMIAFDRDYERYAITDLANQGPLSLRRVENDQELLALPCPGSKINGLKFSPDDRYLFRSDF